MDFQKELEEIRKIKQVKYLELNIINKKEPIYNYNERKNTLDYIKKCTKSDIIKERMDKHEKIDYKNKISKISLKDLENFADYDFNTNFIIDLFKFNFNISVLEKAYQKYLLPPNVLMIKELVTKPKISENFLLLLISDYINSNKIKKTNYINLLISTEILETKYTHVINYIMDLFYTEPTVSVTFEQIKLICSKTDITPDKFKFIISRCSNISAYSKCSKTYVEKSNIHLIKELIRDMEIKLKCKIDIDLYNI
jgi:hypothetical protein